jgi:hypothetical protein
MAATPTERKSKPEQKHKNAERQRLQAALEEGLEETFPASDVVAVSEPRRQATLADDKERAHA